jgi:probable phosphoglycerate mutase
MKIYIVRHGETEWNKLRRVQGHSDIPLNDYGIYLAEQTAKGLKDTDFDIAYTSPLIRAKQTAQIILEGRNIPLVEAKEIQEIGFGALEGLWVSEENQDFMQAFFQDTENYVPAEGGETVQQLMDRTAAFMQTLYQDPDLQDKSILLSSHGGAITAILNTIKGKTSVSEFWSGGVPANCAVTLLEVQDGHAAIVKENQVYY